MPIPISVPRLGWNMDEGVFAGWLKQDGDTICPGDRVFSLEGEKAVEEIESLDGGVLHIPPDGPKPGDRLAVGAVIGFLHEPGEQATAAEPAVPREPPIRQPAASPRARRLAAERGIDWRQVHGGGTTGRVRERDVAAVAGKPTTPPDSGVIPLTPIRKTIAARMTASRQTTAPVTLTTEVDASNLVAFRGQFRTVGEPVPSVTAFLVKLAAVALREHPLLASRWADDGIHPAARLDIGFAVDTEAGLFVPVVRDVPALGLRRVAERVRELTESARAGRLCVGDMQGGCFTVTNLGAFGIDAFTPIINPPECAVLGVGRIARRPIAVGDAIVVRERVTLSLTFDHRIVDGAPAARFLQTLSRRIENPGPPLST
jgi:pyruvate dehydrogenase E2 component (dihydrolipoamide acetyltransferase)